MLLIEPLGTNFNEILIEIHIFSFKKMHLKLSSGKYRPSCLGLNVFMLDNSFHCVDKNSHSVVLPGRTVQMRHTYQNVGVVLNVLLCDNFGCWGL